MLLHEDVRRFRDVLESASGKSGIQIDIVEKDYYVTLILSEIARRSALAVFKGGTSLSKAHKAVNRFSEDIDIAFREHLGSARRKRLKYEVVAPIADKLGLRISNFDQTQSDRDLNCYQFRYEPVYGSDERVAPVVRLETSLVTVSYPVERKTIGNYIAEHADGLPLAELGLAPFDMNVQTLERTFVDKLFAVCDYYLQGKSRRLSRHLYDLHMIRPKVKIDVGFRALLKRVRGDRAKLAICPSAKADVDVNALLREICEKDFFRSDYESVTRFFVFDDVKYDEVRETLLSVADMNLF